MFFSKKKPKIDPKVRFQNRQFNQKLQEARTFKRTAKPIPEGEFDKFLKRIGLGSRWTQGSLILIFLGIIYLIYAPNFLTVQAIKVEGLSDSDRSAVESAIHDRLYSTPFYNPQRNLFFLSKDRINGVVMSVSGIDSVEKITKNFNQKILYVTVKPKHERFLVRSNDQIFDVYNDGTLKGQAGLDHNSWIGVQNIGMVKVDLAAKVPPQETRQFFSSDTVSYIIHVQEALKGIVGSPVAYFSIRIPQLKEQQQMIESEKQEEDSTEVETPIFDTPVEETSSPTVDTDTAAPKPVKLPDIDITLPINADEMDIVMQKGTNEKRTFKVIVDTKENPEALVQRLNLLLSQTDPDRYNNLFYIDMRIPSRAFICLLNTVCNR